MSEVDTPSGCASVAAGIGPKPDRRERASSSNASSRVQGWLAYSAGASIAGCSTAPRTQPAVAAGVRPRPTASSARRHPSERGICLPSRTAADPSLALGMTTASVDDARRAPIVRELLQQLRPRRIRLRLIVGDEPEPHQRLVHLVGAARLRPRFLAHRFDRSRIEAAEIVGAIGIGVTAAHHRLRAALLQRRIVEERIRPRVERFGGDRRRRGEVARNDFDLAAFHPAQHRQPAIDVHRLVQAVVQRLRDQRMVGHLAFADQVLGAGDLVGEHRRQQILRAHALQLRRHLLAAGEARQRQRGRRRPAPAHAEQRRVEQRLDQHVAGRRRMQVMGDVDQREAVAGRQRQHDRVLGRRGLQLEIELAAEALAQRQAPGAVDAAAEGRVDHQLRAAGLVEEALDHERVLRRHQRRARRACGRSSRRSAARLRGRGRLRR